MWYFLPRLDLCKPFNEIQDVFEAISSFEQGELKYLLNNAPMSYSVDIWLQDGNSLEFHKSNLRQLCAIVLEI